MIYLDNASTTYIYPEVKEAIISELDYFGNPSNLYNIGYKQFEKVEIARRKIAKAINCNPEEIFFTSGSSEGNAWALAQGEKCLCSAYEHHNISNNPKSIKIDEDYLDRCIQSNWNMQSYYENVYSKFCCSHMLVNNETGEIFNVNKFFEKAKYFKMFTHCDMTQALGNLKIDMSKYENIDMATFSGHKIHGPKGIGFCYINGKYLPRLKPMIYGGIQESGKRAGTENVPYIVGLGIAVEKACSDAKLKWIHCQDLRNRCLNILFESGLKENEDYVINEGAENIPSTLNIAFKGIEGEVLMLAMQDRNIIVGTGSACNSGDMEPSEVLKEMRVPEDFIHGAIRLSFDLSNKLEDVDFAMRELIKTYKSLTGKY